MPPALSPDLFPIGFGCARLRGSGETAGSRSLIAAAREAGIRYFDTARMYASGEAEMVLGESVQSARGEIVLASKAGILPPRDAALPRWQARAKKLAGRLLPPLDSGSGRPRFGMFDVASLRGSLDDSLAALRTSRLDVLLLHEVETRHLADGRVVGFLDEMVTAGRIGTYGIASTREQTQEILRSLPTTFPIVQAARTVFDGGAPLGRRDGVTPIVHSLLSGALERIVAALRDDAAFRTRWSAEVAVDPANREAIAELLLAEAIDANPGGIVLFSSASPHRIARAAAVARTNPFSPDQIDALRVLARTMSAG